MTTSGNVVQNYHLGRHIPSSTIPSINVVPDDAPSFFLLTNSHGTLWFCHPESLNMQHFLVTSKVAGNEKIFQMTLKEGLATKTSNSEVLILGQP